jgi:hypothetical protein
MMSLRQKARARARRNAVAAVLCTAAAIGQGGCSDDRAQPCACEQQDASADGVPDGAPEAADSSLSDAQAQELKDFCGASWGSEAVLGETCCTEAEKATDVYQAARAVVDAYALECRNMLQDSAAQGRIVLDPDAAAQCRKAFEDTSTAMGCQMLWSGVDWEASGCRGAVRGTQPEGAACRFRYECSDGLTCAGYLPAADGVCVVAPAGGTCREEETNLIVRDVLDSLYGNHPACEPGLTCLHTASELGFCDKASVQGGSCAYDRDCAPGLRCHLGTCGEQGPAAVGGACLLNTDCVQRLWCNTGSCSQRRAAGEPCDTTIDACSGFCVSTDGGTEGTCVAFCGSG